MQTFKDLGLAARQRRLETSALKPWRDDWADMLRAWLDSWRGVFTAVGLRDDFLSGLTVAAVALPLNLALAVASGLPPSAGIVAGALGGVVAAFFGGAPLQVTGPAAALSPLVLVVAQRFGGLGVATMTLLVGVMLLVLAFTRAGHLAKQVPESVLAGFTTGVGLKLLDGELPKLLGFSYKVAELAKMMHQPEWLHEVEWASVVSGLFVALVVVVLKPYRRVPAALLAIGVVTFVAHYVNWDIRRVGEVPTQLPQWTWPTVADDEWLDLFLAMLPLGLLAGVESLLSAAAVDRMLRETRADAKLPPHQPSLELFGQGLANLVVAMFGGMPVTGVVVRSGLNVQSGGRSRLAAMMHGVLLGTAVLVIASLIMETPVAALSGLLLVIGMRLIELRTLAHLWGQSKLEALAFLLAAGGTVSGRLMEGLALGMAVHLGRRWLARGEDAELAQIAHELEPGVRAKLPKERAEARGLRPEAPVPAGGWLAHVQGRAVVAPTAFVHPKASVIGHVVLGDNVHIAAGASVRADEGTPFFIGANSNVQDGVVIHALKDKRVQVAGEEWAVYVGRSVSMAHDALVHGPCYVGDDTFIGFKAVVHDAVVGRHCFVGIGAVVVGVEIPDGRFVPHGSIVDSQDKVDALPLANPTQHLFNEDVVDVNKGLAAAYRAAALGGRPLRVAGGGGPAPGNDWDESWGRGAGWKF